MGLSDRQYFALRRLHSLSGILPIGAFLANHFFTNSFAIGGAESFNHKVEFLRSLPYLFLIEIFGIFLPIAFHAAVGVLIYREARFNNRRLTYQHNYLFTAQRITGVLLLFFITYHVLATRYAHWFGIDNADLFVLMRDKLQNPAIFAIYVLGVLAASFHLGNGVFGFSVHWGLATARASQRRMARVGLAVAALFATLGCNALLAFEPLGGAIPPVRWFIHQAESHETATAFPDAMLAETVVSENANEPAARENAR